MSLEQPNVCIIILNWNGKSDTLDCLNSVQQIDYDNYEIVVVDNGSDDGSVSAIRMSYPKVTVIETGENLGYAGGNNVGVNYALRSSSEYVLLLNNDTIVASDMLTKFIEGVDEIKDGGVYSGKIYFFSEPNRIWYAGTLWVDSKYKFEHVGWGEEDDGQAYSRIAETAYASGCALLISTEVIKKIGLMDERFFLTYEESDWCYRAKREGYKSYYLPKPKIWHKVSASFGGNDTPLVEYFMTRNRLLWAEKNLKKIERMRVFGDIMGELLMQFWPRIDIDAPSEHSFTKKTYWALRQSFRGIVEHFHDPFVKAKLYGVRDYLFRRFYNCPASVIKLNKL